MCGICGVFSSNFSTPEKKIFRDLLRLSEWRGEHSTGIIRLDKNYQKNTVCETSYLKSTLPASVFLHMEDGVDEFLDSYPGRLTGLIGHCRHATKGTITANNAHPFDFDNVIGIHNGTINKTFKNSDKFETDSEAIYSLIDSIGIDETLKEIAGFSSAYTLAWFDKETGYFNIIRNDQRPIWISYFYSQQSLMFASESWMLDVATKRTPVQRNTFDLIKEENNVKYKAFTLGENRLFSFDPEKPKDYYLRSIDVPKPSTTTYSYGGAGYGKDYKKGYYDSAVEASKIKNSGQKIHTEDLPAGHKGNISEIVKAEKNKNKDKSKTSNLLSVVGYNKKLMSMEEFQEALDFGCIFCNEVIPYEEGIDKDLLWYAEGNPVCPSCAEMSHVKEFFSNERRH